MKERFLRSTKRRITIARLATLILSIPIVAQMIQLPAAHAPSVEPELFQSNWFIYRPEPIAPQPQIHSVEWLYKLRNGWGMTNVTKLIVEAAVEVWHDELNIKPTLTGTTSDPAYINDPDHLEGCAVDFRVWGLTLAAATRVSQALSTYLLEQVDDQARVLLFFEHPWRADHIHVEIQDCGRPMTLAHKRPAWGFNV